MNGCIYRTKDGECDLYAEGGKYTAWCDMDNCKGKKMSNADRIRSMSDEELAYIFYFSCDCKYCLRYEPNANCTKDDESCQNRWLDWLKAEGGGSK